MDILGAGGMAHRLRALAALGCKVLCGHFCLNALSSV